MRVKLYFLAFFWPLLLGNSGAFAESPEQFFNEKTISLIIGSNPGGGFDTYARMLAPHLSKATGSDVIVVNRPGAGGHLAINQLYTAKPDGLSIMLAHGTSAVIGTLVGREGIRYELEKFTYLGRVASHNRLWLVPADSDLSVNAFLNGDKRAVFSSTGKIDGFSDSAAVICSVLDLDCKITTGYKVKEAALAVVRGEATAICMSDSSSSVYLSSGDMRAIATLGTERSELYPDIPTLLEQVDIPEENRWPITVHQDIREVGRILIAPPGMSEDKVQFLRKAAEVVLTNPEVMEEGAKIRRHISFAGGPEMQQLVTHILADVTGDRLSEVKSLFLDKYY